MVETSEGEVCKQCLHPHIDGSQEHFTQEQERGYGGGGGECRIPTPNSNPIKNEI
jgi:hypothetical protein